MIQKLDSNASNQCPKGKPKGPISEKNVTTFKSDHDSLVKAILLEGRDQLESSLEEEKKDELVET